MSGRESQMWTTVRGAYVKVNCHAMRVENPAMPGTPDVNWCWQGWEGWVELKCLEKWPTGKDTIVRCEHYTIQQRNWLCKRLRFGGRVAILLKVRQDWLLFQTHKAFYEFGRSATKSQLLVHSTRYWKGRLHPNEFIMALKGDTRV